MAGLLLEGVAVIEGIDLLAIDGTERFLWSGSALLLDIIASLITGSFNTSSVSSARASLLSIYGDNRVREDCDNITHSIGSQVKQKIDEQELNLVLTITSETQEDFETRYP